ncbi:hypothetical protein V1477_009186 [Vespula maculifrons]|uniref:Uncharacterized protein n=4 Tax=Vespula TaxID=7451 RepID=A0A834U3F5_VESGE|nr:hypothetical protein HZH66_003227 [Vespula vulgaris]KAF7415106.1 hypothetical protein HZH68_003595 [Vespula germanica]KAF7435799.1 hypothetical protein H0235_003990 [Vespula pensylvanica]
MDMLCKPPRGTLFGALCRRKASSRLQIRPPISRLEKPELVAQPEKRILFYLLVLVGKPGDDDDENRRWSECQ